MPWLGWVTIDGNHVFIDDSKGGGPHLSPQAAANGEKLVKVNVKAIDSRLALDKQFYVGPGGTGSSASSFKYNRAKQIYAAGNSVEAPSLGVLSDGSVGITDGRHRWAVLRDSGAAKVTVSMDSQSINNARKFKLIA